MLCAAECGRMSRTVLFAWALTGRSPGATPRRSGDGRLALQERGAGGPSRAGASAARAGAGAEYVTHRRIEKPRHYMYFNNTNASSPEILIQAVAM